MQKIGLFFGSFDPIHKGHLKLAEHFVNSSDLDFIWFVITPSPKGEFVIVVEGLKNR